MPGEGGGARPNAPSLNHTNPDMMLPIPNQA